MTCACACGCNDEIDPKDARTCARCQNCRWSPTKHCRVIHRDNYTLTGRPYKRERKMPPAQSADKIELALQLAAKRRRKMVTW